MQLAALKSQIQSALESGRRIIFIDESMFTTATRLTHAYSSKNTNVVLDESLMSNKALAVVAGVSVDGGLEGYLVRE